MAWLGGTVRRWIALVGSLATVAGAVAFAVTEHVALAWLAILGLCVLVVSLVWGLADAHRVLRTDPDPIRSMLDRAIADGRALLTLHEGGSYQWDEWRAWETATSRNLREQVGLQAVYDFEAPAAREREPRGERIAAQVACLEDLRAPH
jgi:hypothetical protein